MQDRTLEDQAREIIAKGCGCDRDCENAGDGCGCLHDARAVIALTQEAGVQDRPPEEPENLKLIRAAARRIALAEMDLIEAKQARAELMARLYPLREEARD